VAARSAGTGGGADLSPRRRGPNFVLEPLNLRLRHRITMAVSSLQLLSLLGRAPRAVCAHMKKTGTGGTRIERKSCSELLLCPPMASVLPHFAKRILRRVSVLWAIPDKQWLDYVIVGRPNAKHNRRRKIKVRHCHAWVAREQGATKQKCEMALNDSLCSGASVRRNAAILPVLGAKPTLRGHR
jgi:hypothetical protein